MREKSRPDEAEANDCGGPTFEAENEVWPDFRGSTQPKSLPLNGERIACLAAIRAK